MNQRNPSNNNRKGILKNTNLDPAMYTLFTLCIYKINDTNKYYILQFLNNFKANKSKISVANISKTPKRIPKFQITFVELYRKK